MKSRLPALAHAMRSTNPTAPSSMSSIVRLLPTISSCIGMTISPQPRPSVSGNSRASRAEIASVSASARARSTSRFRRATPSQLWFRRSARCSSVSASGIQTSLAIAVHDATEAVAGMTPTMVYASSLSFTVRPITSGLPPNSVLQNGSLRTTTYLPPGVSSSCRKTRPSAGRALTISKKPAPTAVERIVRAVPVPVSAKSLSRGTSPCPRTTAHPAASRRTCRAIARRVPPPGPVVMKIRTRRSGSSKGSGRSRTAFTMLKIAVLAPMPSASTLTTATANEGVRDMTRNA